MLFPARPWRGTLGRMSGDTPVRVHTGMAEIDAAAWDACGGAGTPFTRHAFLRLLEESGTVGPATGWRPRHLTVTAPDDGLLAAAPVYLKDHSFGEYIFDWGWAHAFERAGGRYYPKLQVAVPFTPVTGPRLLVHPDAEAPERLRRILADALVTLAEREGASSVHVTFCREDEQRALADAGFLTRLDYQYHWENRGYATFDDFLADLNARKRKTIRRERREVANQGLTVTPCTGRDMTPALWDAFHGFYRAVMDRKPSPAYLNRAFFHGLSEHLPDSVVVMLARDADGAPVAGALNLRDDRVLYGRNWGAGSHHPFLHFEACYYAAIDHAIARGLERVEAGAQGRHKIQRGYLPSPVYAAHWIVHPGLRDAVANYLDEEREAVAAEMAVDAGESPYRREG